MNSRVSDFLESVKRELLALPATIRKSSRSLRRAPGFVAIATLSLGAALGLSTSVFALIDSMRHPESPFAKVDQLYMIDLRSWGSQFPTQTDVDQGIVSLRGLAGHSSTRFQYSAVEFPAGGELHGILYTRAGFFEVLGVQPRLGRVPSLADAGNVALVSDAIWRRQFNNRRRLDGATLSVGDNQYVIIGVIPPRSGFSLGYDEAIFIPDPTPEAAGAEIPLIRIAGGSSDTVLVQSQLNALARRWTQLYRQPTERPFVCRLHSLP